MPTTPSHRFAVLVPVKPPAFAKSRLRDLGDEARRELATAFAVDTVTAALACPSVERVLVVTDDHALAAGLAELGVDVLPDGTVDDLNGTLRLAAAEMHRRAPGVCGSSRSAPTCPPCGPTTSPSPSTPLPRRACRS